MKKKPSSNGKSNRDTLRAEYDFSSAVRGVTAARYAQGSNIVGDRSGGAGRFPRRYYGQPHVARLGSAASATGFGPPYEALIGWVGFSL